MRIALLLAAAAIFAGLCANNMDAVRQFLRPVVNSLVPKAPKDAVLGVIPTMTAMQLHSVYRGKRVLVVGGTRGVGRGISLALAVAGAELTLVGRSERSGQKMLQELRDVPPTVQGSGGAASFSYVQGDLSCARTSLATVDRLLRIAEGSSGGGDDSASAGGRPFDYLVVTAGVFPDWASLQQEDGLEKAFAVAVLGRYALYKSMHRLLRPTMPSDSGVDNMGPRVLNVLAAGDLPYGSFNRAMARGDPASLPTNLFSAIANVGLGNEIMLIRTMRRLRAELGRGDVAMVGTHPGLLSTDLHGGQGWLMDALEPLGTFFVGIGEEECGLRQAAILASDRLHRPAEGAGEALSYVDSDLQGRARSEQLQAQVDEHGDWLIAFLDGLLDKAARERDESHSAERS